MPFIKRRSQSRMRNGGSSFVVLRVLCGLAGHVDLLGSATRETISKQGGGVCVGSEVSAARLPGSRRKTAEGRIQREAGERRNLRSTSASNAWHTYSFPMCAVWNGPAISRRTAAEMSQVRLRTSFLQAVYVLRSLEPIRVHATHTCADSAQG